MTKEKNYIFHLDIVAYTCIQVALDYYQTRMNKIDLEDLATRAQQTKLILAEQRHNKENLNIDHAKMYKS